MKKSKYLIAVNMFLLAIAAFLIQACYTTPHAGSTSPPEGTYNSDQQQGYNLDDLNNYGEWVDVAGYGRVWRPFVVNDWAPYDNGHWSYIDGNWTWVSYEPFGWIVYHYGYWYDDPFYHWVWIPSNDQWSPARVRWNNYDNYVCWAPLPPPGREIVYGNPWDAGEGRPWHVVRKQDFARDNVSNYRVQSPPRSTAAVRNETGERNRADRRPPSGNETGGRNRTNANPPERNNTGERNRNQTNPPDRNNTGDRTRLENKPPAKQDIEKAAGTRIEDHKAQYHPVKTPAREIKKLDLPPQEQKKVDQNEKQVKQKVLVPKKEAIKKEAEKKKEEKK